MLGNHIPSNAEEGGISNNYGLRYRKNVTTTSLLSSPTRKIQKAQLIKKSAVSNIIWSVRRSIRGGSQLFNKRGVSYRWVNKTYMILDILRNINGLVYIILYILSIFVL